MKKIETCAWLATKATARTRLVHTFDKWNIITAFARTLTLHSVYAAMRVAVASDLFVCIVRAAPLRARFHSGCPKQKQNKMNKTMRNGMDRCSEIKFGRINFNFHVI